MFSLHDRIESTGKNYRDRGWGWVIVENRCSWSTSEIEQTKVSCRGNEVFIERFTIVPESTSDVTEGVYAGERAGLVYGVFTTPVNSIGGSAVCAFSMKNVLEVFQGAFKEQETINSNWLRVLPEKVPEPRPGACVNDSRTLPDVTVNFVKAHPLMDIAVQSFFSLPVITKVSFK